MYRIFPFVGLKVVLLLVLLQSCPSVEVSPEDNGELFSKDNLVAWCIVPFDPANRTPQERVQMLKKLGITKFAYDWREQHVPTFAEEISECKRSGIEFFAFWGWHEDMARLVPKYGVRPQFWLMIPEASGEDVETKVAKAAEAMLPDVNKVLALECKVGLYNHGGWQGQPENLIAVSQNLRALCESDDIGIVYNLHHAHDRLEDLPENLKSMMPYLLCLNVNGMNASGDPNILPIGQGDQDQRVLRIIEHSGYEGPIGILDHRPEKDAEQSLRENLKGLSKLTGLKLID